MQRQPRVIWLESAQEKKVMYSDYNESTRRLKNLGRIEYFWDQQEKVL
jgi:hypothetical protein